MNAIDLLKKQHQTVKDALKSLVDSDSIDNDELLEIADELVAHMVIEEHVFYPRVRQLQPDLVSESFEEHTVARFELARAIAAKSDEDKKSCVTVLQELIEHHVEEEEKEMFPKVRSKISSRELETLGERMEAMFEKATRKGFASFVTPTRAKPIGRGQSAAARRA